MELMRLGGADLALARATFMLMGEVFDEDPWVPLGDPYLRSLLDDARVWAYAAVSDGRPIGGLVAHQLPMTRAEVPELLIYDLAVDVGHQRRGVGRALIARIRSDAAAVGIGEMWVPADDDDEHALEFYRNTGASSQAVTIFTYATAGAQPREWRPAPPTS